MVPSTLKKVKRCINRLALCVGDEISGSEGPSFLGRQSLGFPDTDSRLGRGTSEGGQGRDSSVVYRSLPPGSPSPVLVSCTSSQR